MSSNKIHKLKSVFTANGGGCGCRPKPTDIIEPQPQPKPKSSFSDKKSSHLPSSSSASSSDRLHGGDCTSGSTSFSYNVDASPHYRNDFSKIQDSVAVVKDSNDPYQDFRQSMLQMIIEKEIFSRNDLQQLLDCFLKLNSPRHHQVIVQAFIEIWNGGGGGTVA